MSAETLKIEITPRGQKAIADLASFPQRLMPAIARGLDAALEESLQQTLKTRFTGKGPFDPAMHRLGVRSGLLRTSFTRDPATIEGSTVTAAVGSRVKYWLVHEFGYSGQVMVKAHRRQIFLDDKNNVISRKRERRMKESAREKLRAKTFGVEEHVRWMLMPERAPMRTGLREQLPRMSEIISAFIVREWRTGGGEA